MINITFETIQRKLVNFLACPKGYYKCDDGKCIFSEQRCDGNIDCGDNSDEQNCEGKLVAIECINQY